MCISYACTYVKERDSQKRKLNNLNSYSIKFVTLKYAFQLAVMIDNIITVCLCCQYHMELNNTFSK